MRVTRSRSNLSIKRWLVLYHTCRIAIMWYWGRRRMGGVRWGEVKLVLVLVEQEQSSLRVG